MELMVVLAILALLMVLTLRIRSQWKTTAQSQACVTAMASLRSASKLYDQTIPTALNYADAAGYSFKNNTLNRPLSPMEYFLYRTSGVPKCQDQLARIPSTMLIAEDPAPGTVYMGTAAIQANYTLKTVVDPWGLELAWRSTFNAAALAADQSNPTLKTQAAALPFVTTAIFSSAGPDGLWGTLNGNDPSQPDDDAQDNIRLSQ